MYVLVMCACFDNSIDTSLHAVAVSANSTMPDTDRSKRWMGYSFTLSRACVDECDDGDDENEDITLDESCS